MNGKATGVFWIGLILIFLNFWLSGQSSLLWSSFTNRDPNNSIQQTRSTNLKKGIVSGTRGVGKQPGGGAGIGANYH